MLNSNIRGVRGCNGFTLVEVLVVLVLIALTSVVIFEALERSYRLQERFGVEIFSAQQDQMALDWYRQSVQGLQPDYPDGVSVFRGTAQEFHGLSTNPLTKDAGVPSAIGWKFRSVADGRTVDLLYVDGGREATVKSWRIGGESRHRFVFLDDELVPHTIWPPATGASSQLPRQIQLHASGDQNKIVLAVTLMGPRAPPLRVKDVQGER